MKKFTAIILSLILILSVFVACGKKEEEIKDDVKDEITKAEDDMTTALDEAKNDIEDFAEDLTEGGNVTNQTEEGKLQEAITDMSEMLEDER